MHTKDIARAFADEWISAWNSRDLVRILSHYADDFEMTTPFVVSLIGVASGTLKGKEVVGAYWRKALGKFPDLHFELIDVFYGATSMCIAYKSVLGLRAVEWLHFDSAGKVTKAMAHYDDFPA